MVWTKRAKFIAASLLLTAGLLSTQFTPFAWRYWSILVLSLLASGLAAWVLAGELYSIQWLTCLLLPTVYTASVALFYFLLPERIITRIVILSAFAIGMYAILLTENIFSIASGRTIQLLRAAQAVGFLMTLISCFFLYDTIFSFRLEFFYNFILVMVVSIPLFFQAIWSADLESSLEKNLIVKTLALAFLVGQVAATISFWPLSIWLASLFLVTFFYITVGLVQHQESGRLFAKTVSEYLQVGFMVLVVTIILAQWGGT